MNGTEANPPREKTVAQMHDEIAREILRALGFELFDELRAPPPRPGLIAVAMLPEVRAGRREGDHPAYISLEQFDEVITLLAHYRLGVLAEPRSS